MPESDEAQAQAEAAVVVPPHQAVHLEGDRQAVGGGAGQRGALHELGQRGGAGLERAQHADRLVEHAHAA